MYESKGNKYYKFGQVPVDPKTALTQHQIVTKFEVGPGGSQISLDELRAAAQGRSIQKRHTDGQVTTNRIDAQLIVGPGEDQWSQKELSEIYKIEKQREADRLAALPKQVEAEDLDDLKKVLSKQKAQLAAQDKRIKEMEDAKAGLGDSGPDTDGTRTPGAPSE